MELLTEKTTVLIAGIDDATKCPVIGSIFLAGVIADKSTIDHWKKIGVNDSKLIAAKKREELAQIIKETATGFVIEEITPAMIDDKSFNLNEWEMLVVLKIVKKLSKFGMPSPIIIDNWETSEKGFKQRLHNLLSSELKSKVRAKKFIFNSNKLLKLSYLAEHKADENHIIVGAASILAKTSSDAQYRSYRKKFGDFGSGSPADPKTRHFVWQHRHNPLPIIRTSWNTFKTLSQLDSIEQDFLYNRVKKRAIKLKSLT